MAFGLSGSEVSSQMEGADVAVAHLDSIRGYVVDYNITAKAPVCKCKECNYVCVIKIFVVKKIIHFLSWKQCGKVLGQYKGVCRDELFGGLDNNQLHTAFKENGITVINYRRTLNSCKLPFKIKRKRLKGNYMRCNDVTADPGDKEYPTDRSVYVVWALGRLNENKEPTFHDLYLKNDLKLELGRKEPEDACMDFTENNEQLV